MTLYGVCKAIGNSGGATLKYRNGKFKALKRKRGYAVSLYGYEKTIPHEHDDSLYDVMIDYMNDNYTILSQDDKYIGVWVDKGDIYLDITIILNDRIKALLRGRLEHQKAIYDFSTCQSLCLDDYQYMIDNVVLFEKVNSLMMIDDLRYIRTPHSRQLGYCNARMMYDTDNYDGVYIYYSYNTVVMIQIGHALYFNRLMYSMTTTQHLHRFINKYHLKSLNWYQLHSDEWYRLLNQLNVSTQYGPRYEYYDNNYKWLYDIETITS